MGGENVAGRTLTILWLVRCGVVVDIPEECSCFVPSSFCICTERVSSQL